MTATANDILMGSGGAPSAKFTEGVSVTGRIVAISEPYQEREYDPNNPGGGKPKVFPKSGDPIMTFNIDVATNERDASIEDDDGTRRVYMDGARIKKAVREGVRLSGAPGLAVGGTITITCTHYDTAGDIRSGKNYKVEYVPGAAANTVLMGNPQTGEVSAPAAAPAPAQQASPPAAPAAPAGPTPEQIAALQAAGIDPATVYPNYQG